MFRYDITKYKGETLLQGFRLEDKFGNPLDLTGYTAKLQVRNTVNDGDDPQAPMEPLLELTTENGGIIIDAEVGRITLYHPKLTTPITGVYDLFLIDEDGNSTVIVNPKSKFKVLESVTNV